MTHRIASGLILALLFVSAVLAERGIPLGPCTDGVATHYGDDYIFNPSQGGTCSLEPPKYANYGRLTACSTGANSIYNPLNPNRADGCGVCYEVYGLNGAVTVIIGDHGSSPGTDFNLISKNGNGAWDEIINAGIGSHQMSYRQVSCPQEDGGLDWVKGNIKVTWQDSGANNFYFELHFWNHLVGIKSVSLTSSLHTDPVSLIRKEVQNNFVYATTDAGGSLPSVSDVGLPFTLKITSFFNEELTTTVGTAGQSIADVAYGGGSSPIEFDFGSQFTNTNGGHSGDADCTPPADPQIVYDDVLYYDRGAPNIGWRHVNSYTMTSGPDFGFSSNCADGSKCIQAQFGQYGGIIIGVVKFMKADWTGIKFKVKGASAFDGLALSWNGQTDKFSFPVTTAWVEQTMNFADYPTIPDLIDPGHFSFTSNAASPVVYFDSIEMVGGTGRANYVPGAKVFPASNPNSGDGGAASNMQSLLSDIL